MPEDTSTKRIGLLAAWGHYPLIVSEHLLQQGYEIYGLGIRDHVPSEFPNVCAAYREVGLAQLGAGIRFLKRHHVAHATMAGKVHKTTLFHRYAWIRHTPDLTGVRAFYRHFITRTKNRNDDSLILALVEAYARAGITFGPATDYAPELLVKYGKITGGRLNSGIQKDIAFGWKLAKEMGGLDVGQSVVIKGRAAIAVEAIEGTDACIRRAGELCSTGGFTVVKVAKPNQDMRFDVPTIGPGTMQTMSAAGGKVLAIEADKTILLDRDEVIRLAKQYGITIVAVREEDIPNCGDAEAA